MPTFTFPAPSKITVYWTQTGTRHIGASSSSPLLGNRPPSLSAEDDRKFFTIHISRCANSHLEVIQQFIFTRGRYENEEGRAPDALFYTAQLTQGGSSLVLGGANRAPQGLKNPEGWKVSHARIGNFLR